MTGAGSARGASKKKKKKTTSSKARVGTPPRHFLLLLKDKVVRALHFARVTSRSWGGNRFVFDEAVLSGLDKPMPKRTRVILEGKVRRRSQKTGICVTHNSLQGPPVDYRACLRLAKQSNKLPLAREMAKGSGRRPGGWRFPASRLGLRALSACQNLVRGLLLYKKVVLNSPDPEYLRRRMELKIAFSVLDVLQSPCQQWYSLRRSLTTNP